MEFKGTKGKWFFSEDVDTHYSQPVINIDSTSGFETFITVWSGLSISSQLDKTTKANALLISKSPEMLDFINRISGEMLRNDFVLDDKWYDKAQQLIKEATEL